MLPTRGKRFLLYAFQLSQIAQHRTDIGIEQNGLRFKFSHGDGLAQSDAGISSPFPKLQQRLECDVLAVLYEYADPAVQLRDPLCRSTGPWGKGPFPLFQRGSL